MTTDKQQSSARLGFIGMGAMGSRRLITGKLFLNLGTHASIPLVPGLVEAKPLTNIEALELGWLPGRLIVLGGGYVGLELAQAYRRFGSRVTIIDHGPRLVSSGSCSLLTILAGYFAIMSFSDHSSLASRRW